MATLVLLDREEGGGNRPARRGLTRAGTKTAAILVLAEIAAACTGGVSPTPDRSPSPTIQEGPSGVPSASLSIDTALSPSPSSEPSVSPAAQLQRGVADYLSGKTAIPDRFSVPGTMDSPLNIVLEYEPRYKGKDVNTSLTVQGFLIGEEVIYDNDNVGHLIAMVGLRDGTREDPASPGKGRFTMYVNLGRPGTNDRDSLYMQGYSVRPAVGTVDKHYPTSDMKTELARYNGRNVLFPLMIINDKSIQGPDHPNYARSFAEFRAQYAVAVKSVDFCIATLAQSVSEVVFKLPSDDPLRRLINVVPETFNPYDVPSTVLIVPYPLPPVE